MTTKYFDSHAHLSSEGVYKHIEEILARAKAAGVTKIVNICTDEQTLINGLKLAKAFPWVYNTASTTPHDVDKEGEKVFPLMAKHARNGDLVAIGETGLDYYYDHSSPETQQEYLRKYLQLALECDLPVVIHCREAFADFFSIIDSEYTVSGRHAPGVLHCFTGTLAEAEEVVKRGWYLSLSGIVTFKKSEELREVAKMVPLNQLFIETDTPYLAPQSHRGKTNEPAFVVETARKIAEVKGISVEKLAKATKENAEAFFRI
jgi:TatD DNase family protein